MPMYGLAKCSSESRRNSSRKENRLPTAITTPLRLSQFLINHERRDVEVVSEVLPFIGTQVLFSQSIPQTAETFVLVAASGSNRRPNAGTNLNSLDLPPVHGACRA